MQRWKWRFFRSQAKYRILIPKAIKRRREFGKQLVIPRIVEFTMLSRSAFLVSYCATFAHIQCRSPSVFVVGQYVIEPLASNFAGRYISPGGKLPAAVYIAKSARDLPQAWKYNPGCVANAPYFQLLPMLPFLELARAGFRPEKRHVGNPIVHFEVIPGTAE